jgi:hypothetical protein
MAMSNFFFLFWGATQQMTDFLLQKSTRRAGPHSQDLNNNNPRGSHLFLDDALKNFVWVFFLCVGLRRRVD